MDVISEMLGVPVVDRAAVRNLADLVMHRDDGIADIPPEGVQAAFDLVGYFNQMIEQRRHAKSDDLTSALMEAELDGDKLAEDEILSFLFLMVVAGNETTTKLISNAWYWGWRNPAEAAKPFSDPSRIPHWIEETLRFDTSSQMLVRVTNEEMELHGTFIPSDSKVILLVGSANRDEAVFEHADRYDLDRDTTQLVSFGSGRHFCLGAALARLEARVCLEELVTRVSGYEIDTERSRRVHSSNVRGFGRLPTSVLAR